MTVIGVTLDGKKIVYYSASGPSSYATGGSSITINDLNKVEAVLFAQLTGGYLVEATPGTTTNTVTVKVYYFDYDASADGTAIEIPDGTDLSGKTLTLLVIGV